MATFKSDIMNRYNKSSDMLYENPSPYDAQSDNSFLSFGPRQPYVYKKLTEVRSSNSLSSLFNADIEDLERVTKFMGSSHGMFFIGKQSFLQSMQPFNETRIYNPLSPILSTARPLTFGITDRPVRHFDMSNPLQSMLGIKLGNTKFIPPGSVGGDNLPFISEPKGLLRAGTSNFAYGNLSKTGGGDFAFGGLLGMASQLFNSYSVQTQTGNPTYRADELGYNIYLSKSDSLFRQGGIGDDSDTKLDLMKWKSPIAKQSGVIPVSYGETVSADYSVNYSEIESQFTTSSVVLNQKWDFKNKYYKNPASGPADGNNGIRSVEQILDSLYENVLTTYNVTQESAVDVLYHNTIANKKYYKNAGKLQYDFSVSKSSLANEISRIDTSSVLDENSAKLDYIPRLKNTLPFYFYDVVNQKYIPFNATIKGISDSFTAEWSEVKYVGRADKLYNYTGYSRALNFTFFVYANSMKELLPMWKRINYLTGLTKPANYTAPPSYSDGGVGKISDVSSFIIPPLVKLTVGDFYKNQPIVFENVSISIADDAIWETVGEKNSETWEMGNIKIDLKNPKAGILYVGRFPREANVQVQCKLLEKERPVTRHNNWGDYLIAGDNGKDNRKANVFSQQILA